MEKVVWEVTIIKLKNNVKRYKVTRRIHELSIAETRIFILKQYYTKIPLDK